MTEEEIRKDEQLRCLAILQARAAHLFDIGHTRTAQRAQSSARWFKKHVIDGVPYPANLPESDL